MMLVHGTTVGLKGKGVLIRGPSGSGKSDLALRLIDGGACLVSDDQTELTLSDGRLLASAPATIAGYMEVRGVGVVRLPYLSGVPLALVVDLVRPDEIERLPDPATVTFLGLAVPVLRLWAFESAAAAKVRLAALSPTRDIMDP